MDTKILMGAIVLLVLANVYFQQKTSTYQVITAEKIVQMGDSLMADVQKNRDMVYFNIQATRLTEQINKDIILNDPSLPEEKKAQYLAIYNNLEQIYQKVEDAQAQQEE